MIALVDGVDRGRLQQLVLGRRQRDERLAALDELPAPLGELLVACAAPARPALRRAVGVGALAVDRHRGGDGDPLDRVAPRLGASRQHLEHDRRGHDVVARVVDDVGHALADADRGRQVGEVGHALDARLEHAVVEQVALDAPRARVEVDRPAVVIELAHRRGPAATGCRGPSPRSRAPAWSSTRCEPMKPAPPVIRTCLLMALLHRRHLKKLVRARRRRLCFPRSS